MEYKLIGSPCGEYGPYTFYKGFKFTKNNKIGLIALNEFFFVKLWPDSDLISIGELQLLWKDKNSEQTLASLRLYILPENTPDGRTDVHGEDEVLAIQEKVVLRVEDLLTWMTAGADWHWGIKAVWEKDCKEPVKIEPEEDVPVPEPAPQEAGAPAPPVPIDMEEVKVEKERLPASHWESTAGVLVLSYPRYCRYRAMLKRLEGVTDRWLRHTWIIALGGVTAAFKNTRVLFCKDTFDYPELEGHELLCNYLAPKLKGKSKLKRRKAYDSASNDSASESESSKSSSGSSTARPKMVGLKPRLRCTLEVKGLVAQEEKSFMATLHAFMNERRTPISRIPVVGFKEVNLYRLYKKVRELGGYELVTASKLWKHVYEVIGGDAGCTSAATLSRRHYEKLLLPFERHYNGKLHVKPRVNNINSNAVDELKNNKQITITPLVKKQKLDILKEGGLEVTPVGAHLARSSVMKPNVVHVPVMHQSNHKPANNKVSITVTPDIPMIFSGTPAGPSNVKKTVYGNPKEVLPSAKRLPPGAEVLDLRTKPRPAINLGSNLEITLVPQPRSSMKPVVHHQTKKRPQGNMPLLKSMPASKGHHGHSSHRYPHNPYQYKAAGYMPMMDPLYLSALYSGMLNSQLYPAQTQEQINYYKEMIRRQGMYHLMPDGSTSITLVGQTPTSK